MSEAEAKKQTGIEEVYYFNVFADFVEICGYKGGDVLTFRIYEDGLITER